MTDKTYQKLKSMPIASRIAILVFTFLFAHILFAVKADMERSKLTDPMQRARYDRGWGRFDAALSDLEEVPPSSDDYNTAQWMKAEIKRQKLAETPLQIEQIRRAEDNCKKTTNDSEEFPSTVDFNLFGTNSEYDRKTATIAVTVDYTAKNSIGADLPYRMRCYADRDGNVGSYNRMGR